MQKLLVYSGIVFFIFASIWGCDSKKEPGPESGESFDDIDILQEIVGTLAKPVTYSANVTVQTQPENYTGTLTVDRKQNSVLTLEREPAFKLTLNDEQLVTTGQNPQTFELSSPDNLDWLRVGEFFVLEPNILARMKETFIFKTAAPLKSKLFVTAYPKKKNHKIELISMKYSQNPLRLQSVDVLLRSGTLACHAEYDDYTEVKGGAVPTRVTVSWMVDWKPQQGVFVLMDLK